MLDRGLLEEVRGLRARGLSPKQIARALGVRPAEVTPLVRTIASEQAASAPEPALVGCWVSPGWSAGLIVEKGRGWPDRQGCGTDAFEAVAVLVAREDRRHVGRVSVCAYLVDTYCLGVKDVLGPRRMDRHELTRFARRFFDAFDGEPVEAPIEMARHLVWGAVEFARELGFSPHRDFEPTAGHLGALRGPSAIRFGRYGRPYYMQGPFDNAARIMRTLEERVGLDNFSFVISVEPEALSRFTA